MKILIIILLIAIFSSLFAGGFFLLRDRGQSKRLVRSLALRVGLALLLFLILSAAIMSGYIKPRSFPLQAPPDHSAPSEQPLNKLPASDR